MLGKRSGALKRFFSLVTGLPLSGLRSYKSVFGRLCRKTVPRGGKTRGSCTEKRCSHKWFHMIFPCTDSCTNTFCTSSSLHPHSPPRNPEGVANLKKAICVVRGDSIIGVTLYVLSLLELKSLDDVGAGKLREMLTLHKNPHVVHGRFTLKDDCERQVWNAGVVS